MSKFILTTAFFILIVVDLAAQFNLLDNHKIDRGYNKYLRENRKKTPKGFRDNYILVEGGRYASGVTGIQFNSKPAGDTNTLLNLFLPKRVVVQSFFLQKTEVTNLQYKQFTDWVIDSIALTMLATGDPSYYKDPKNKLLDWTKRNRIREVDNLKKLYPLFFAYPQKNDTKYYLNDSLVKYRVGDKSTAEISVYPDTLCWIRYISGIYNDQLAKAYFSSHYFADFPVVGVSRNQANAYCDWLGQFGDVDYRLPTVDELAFALIPARKLSSVNSKPFGGERRSNNIKTPTWFDSYVDYDANKSIGKHGTNSGQVIDPYGFVVKDYKSDGYMYTSAVGSYPKSVNGFSDLQGNVAEWTSDKIDTVFLLKDILGDIPPIGNYSNHQKKSIGNGVDSNNNAEEQKHLALKDTLSVSISESFESIAKKLFDYHYNDPDLIRTWAGKMTMEKLKERPNYIVGYKESYDLYINEAGWGILQITKGIYDDFSALRSNRGAGIITGGSFWDEPALLRPGVRRAFSNDNSHISIGFRTVAIPRVTQ